MNYWIMTMDYKIHIFFLLILKPAMEKKQFESYACQPGDWKVERNYNIVEIFVAS